MRKTFTAFAAAALALGFAAADAQAGNTTLNGLGTNGIVANGIGIVNGIQLSNGMTHSNALTQNGLPQPNALTQNGMVQPNGVTQVNGIVNQNGLAGAGIGGVVTAITLPAAR